MSEGEVITEIDRVEMLRGILEREQGRAVTYDEASQIAGMMVSFYETLAEGLTAEDLIEVDQ